MKHDRRATLKWLVGSGAALFLGGCGKGPEPGEPSRRRYQVYLTTDDGPLRGSENVDRVIRETGVPMTAFVVGRHAQSSAYRARLDAYRKNPHIRLANHSYTHADGRYADYYRHPQHVLEDFEMNARILGLSGKVGRLPGRDSWRLGGRRYDADRSARAAADLLAQHGYRLYGWDLEWTHTHSGAPIGTAEVLGRKIRHQLEKGHCYTPGHLVLLMHDQMFRGRGAMEELRRLIQSLQNDPAIELQDLENYPVFGPIRLPASSKGTKLIKGPTTGVSETTPVDPLKFAH